MKIISVHCKTDGYLLRIHKTVPKWRYDKDSNQCVLQVQPTFAVELLAVGVGL
jgi:hypothetical protein